MEVVLENLTKHFGKVVAVDNLNLEIKDGEFVALLGPSGCGKTTTLLMVAGIYKPTSGYVKFDGQVVNHLLPKDRNIGMVFQSYALYPHMTVFENLTFPLKLKKVPMSEMKEKAQRIARMLGIEQLMDRRPGQLSGGQQQRVALGRALIKEPKLLLFDEPLSNLDARLRLAMRGEIKRLQMELGITSIYVTHDQVEAMTMADRIAVLNNGQLQAYAPPEELYDRPRTLFVAGFIGNPPMNLFEMELYQEGDKYKLRRGDIRLEIPDERKPRHQPSAAKVIVGLRPEDVYIGSEGDLDAEVYMVEPLGRDDIVTCSVGDIKVHTVVDSRLGYKIGDKVKVRFDMSKVQLYDSQTELSLLWA